MNNFRSYMTPEQLKAAGAADTLDRLKKLASRKPRTCLNCDELEWVYGQTGLCFSCTTGESDASDDYEILHQGASI
jgi:hypothetical protein